MNEQIRILIVDDHTIVRDGLQALINAEPGMQVVGVGADGVEAVEKARDLQPDVILLDLMMPRKDGVQATAEIKKENPAARILVLTSFAEDHQVFSAVKAGAMGYLMKDTSSDELIQAIWDVYRNKPALQPPIARKLMRDIQGKLGQTQAENALTEREIEILQMVAQGRANQQIADELFLSERTVRTHITNILGKLRLENRTQAALYALREGIAHLPYTTESPDEEE
jgi:two-component system, NarL family, response regulator LiaR